MDLVWHSRCQIAEELPGNPAGLPSQPTGQRQIWTFYQWLRKDRAFLAPYAPRQCRHGSSRWGSA
jgi:hypothetical protein